MIAVAVVGGTLAYMTDEDGAKNVMTFGEVSIVQTELQRKDGIDDNATLVDGDLVPFEQGQRIYPVCPLADGAFTAAPDQANSIKWGPYVTANGAWNGLYRDAKLTNIIDKFVFVTNDGTEDAYFRTIVAYECPDGYTCGDLAYDDIGANVNARYGQNDDCVGVQYVVINNVRYAVETYYYNSVEESIVKVGETMRPSLLQVGLSNTLDNEDIAKWGTELDVLVLTQATQTTGFPDAKTACDMAFGEVNADNYVEWLTPIANAPAGPVDLG